MLERLGTGKRPTLETPSAVTVDTIGRLAGQAPAPVYAEIGIGIGATALAVAEILANRGTLYLFDYADKVDELAADLAARGFRNVVACGNSRKTYDSYGWSLLKLIDAGERGLFDFVYLDGAHDYLHDGAALLFVDKLLKPGGYLEIDDYTWTRDWSFAYKGKPTGTELYTPEQTATPQVKLLVDHIVREDPRYQEILDSRLFRKQGGIPS